MLFVALTFCSVQEAEQEHARASAVYELQLQQLTDTFNRQLDAGAILQQARQRGEPNVWPLEANLTQARNDHTAALESFRAAKEKLAKAQVVLDRAKSGR